MTWVLSYMQHLRGWKEILSRSLGSMGALWLVSEIVAFTKIAEIDSPWLLWLIVSLSAVCGLWPKRRRKQIKVQVSRSVQHVTVDYSDLLDSSGNVAIGTNTAFDSAEGAEIDEKSVQSQFTRKVFPNDKARFEDALERKLGGIRSSSRKSKKYGHKRRFPNGTTVKFSESGTNYFLFAYAHMDDDTPTSKSSPRQIADALFSLWDDVRDRGNMKVIHIPLIGTAFARSGLTARSSFALIAESFVAENSRNPVCRGLHIHLRKSPEGSLSIEDIEEHLRSICSK